MTTKESPASPKAEGGEKESDAERAKRRRNARSQMGRIFRVVLVIMKIYKAAVSTSELIRKFQTSNIGEIFSAEEKEKKLRGQGNTVQVFDVSKFKSYGKVTELSEKCRKAMRTPFLLRTDKDIKEIVTGMKLITQFLEFPDDILRKIASRIWIEWFPAHRVIVRQGHRGENYYVILSGRIEVSVIEVNPVDKEIKPRTVNVLGKGQAFGEKALLGDVKRNATCVSLDRVELLVLAKDAFIQIVSMRSDLDASGPAGDLASREPEHIKFLRKIPFLKFFPISVLWEDFESCQFYYYRRGMLICPDVNTTQRVYVIKTGSCSVIMEMEKCKFSISRDQVEYGGPTVQEILSLSRPKLTYNSGSRTSTSQSNRRPWTRNESRREILPEISSSKGTINGSQSRVRFDLTRRPIRESGRLSSRIQRPLYSSSSSSDYQTNGNVFIRVSALLPGDEFGLNTLNKRNHSVYSGGDVIDEGSPRFSLVSNGCECISISKDVLLRYSSTLVVKQMKESMTQYPNSQVLRLRLKNTEKWQSYRRELINQCVDQKLHRVLNKRTINFN